jgi:tetratricopeptide (TPR) repeat protein
METPAVEEEVRAPQRMSLDEMRTSLLSVQAAQAAARARNRRETLKARLMVGTAVVTFVVGVVATRTRAARGPEPRRRSMAVAVAPVVPHPPVPAAPVAAEPAAPPAPPAPPVAPAIATRDGANASAVDECEALVGRHLWRQAAEPCASAAKARPNDAAVALALSQSEHARNRLAEAGRWARRAIALDPKLPEAFVIRAHAEAQAGQEAAAARDFRRYLALAPHGWHAREARAALRPRQSAGDASSSVTSESAQ